MEEFNLHDIITNGDIQPSCFLNGAVSDACVFVCSHSGFVYMCVVLKIVSFIRVDLNVYKQILC